MGTSKLERKYGMKPKEKESKRKIEYRVLINNRYYLPQAYESWEDAESAGNEHTKGKKLSYVVVTGV